jgi:hypothetical protein
VGWPFGETVTRLQAQTVADPYSTETREVWDDPSLPPVEVALEGCAVEPRPSTEDQGEARNAVTDGFTVYLPPEAAEVTSRHRVRVRGAVYSVLGEAADWRSPLTGWIPGRVIQCERVTG